MVKLAENEAITIICPLSLYITQEWHPKGAHAREHPPYIKKVTSFQDVESTSTPQMT